MNKNILEKVNIVLEPVIKDQGYQLVDTEFIFEQGRNILRIYIDKPNGVTISDCALVSRLAGDLLDTEDVIHNKYYLEVSSPGLDRPLKTIDDFKKYIGNKVKIKTKESIEGRGNYKGLLETVENNEIIVNVDNIKYKLTIDNIERARLIPELK